MAPPPPRLLVGSAYSATVKSIQPYGAFCELHGVGATGLLHVSRLDPAGGRVPSVEAAVSVGDRLAVRVLSVGSDGKIALAAISETPKAGSRSSGTRRIPPSAEELGGASYVSLVFSRSSGAGGQNVNKLSTRCEARLDLGASGWPEGVTERLKSKSSSKGEVIVTSDRHRTQGANKKDALEKLAKLVATAWHPPKVRRQYQGISAAGKFARREKKRQISEKKKSRSAARRGVFDMLTQADAGVFGRRFALSALAFFTLEDVVPNDNVALATDCDDACRQRIADRRKLFEQSRTTSDRQTILDLSRQRAALYNTTFQGASCIPGIPCLTHPIVVKEETGAPHQ
ncbi:MAG: hypothetical protein SGPRY_003276 [Prymnesium sp.]